MKLLYWLYVLANVWMETLGGEDYYKLLNVDPSATTEQIRRAFRKLAIRYHPDKNKDNSEQARQKFAQIANAYDILIDPEKRRIYNQFGEEGIKKPQQDWMNQGHQGIFRHFFGGQQFEAHFGPGQHNFGLDHDEYQRRVAVFQGTEVVTLNMDTISRFYRREEVWFVYFFKPQDEQHPTIADSMVKLCAKAEHLFQVAAINCQEQEELCEDFNMYGTPKVLLYKQSGNEEPTPWSKGWNVDEMAQQALGSMNDFVEIINDDTYEEFMNRHPQQIKVVYFSKAEGTPALVKLMSSEYKGYLHFGLVRATEKQLLSQYNVTDFPTLLVINDTETKGERYIDEWRRDRLLKHLRQFKYSKMKVPQNLVRKLTKQLWDSGRCGPGDDKMCLLLLVEADNDADIATLTELTPHYEHDPISFYYVNIKEQSELVNAFPKVVRGKDRIVLFKPRRGKYGVLEGVLDTDNLLSFIDSVTSLFQLLSSPQSTQPLTAVATETDSGSALLFFSPPFYDSLLF